MSYLNIVKKYCIILLLSLLTSPVWANYDASCELQVLYSGQYLGEVSRSIENANNRIYVAHYIINEDYSGKSILSNLLEAAQRGVEVKVIYDAIGPGPNFEGLTDETIDLLIAAGIDVKVFNPLRRSIIRLGFGISKRLHDKLVIIDDQYFVGSSGIWAPSNHHLIELDIKIKHSTSLEQALHSFETIWNSKFSKNKKMSYRFKRAFEEPDLQLQQIQSYINNNSYLSQSSVGLSRPLTSENCKIEYLSDLLDKKEEPTVISAVQNLMRENGLTYIYNPYFIPEKSFKSFLKEGMGNNNITNLLVYTNTAAKLGAELKALGVAYSKRYNYFEESGISLKEYSGNKMLHAKVIVSPNNLYIGSLNLDPLGIKKNFENGVIIDLYSIPGLNQQINTFEFEVEEQSILHFMDGTQYNIGDEHKIDSNLLLNMTRPIWDRWM